MNNCNCDGSGPHSGPEVRVLPLGKNPHHGNLILCRNCHARELEWRKERNPELAEDCRYDLPAWESLEVYP